MGQNKRRAIPEPQAGWAVYLRTSSDENQKPELSRARQRYAIEKNVLERSEMPVYGEYIARMWVEYRQINRPEHLFNVCEI